MHSGILNLAKPVGVSSFAVVRTIGHLPGVVKAGHGGTLDPAAEGVLPVLVNAATRLADFVHPWRKTYLATAVFGFTSDTYDREGTLASAGEAGWLTAEAIGARLPSFIGRIEQVPPMHSALKRGGEALYRKARRGETIALEPRTVEVYSLRLLSFELVAASAQLEIVCGQGTYVRSLVHDLGQALGCGAYLAALTRSEYGPLRLDEAVPAHTLEESGPAWTRWLLPMELPLRDWPSLQLKAIDAEAIRQGRGIPAPAATAGRYRLLDRSGALMAWGVVADGRLRPKAVFPE